MGRGLTGTNQRPLSSSAFSSEWAHPPTTTYPRTSFDPGQRTAHVIRSDAVRRSAVTVIAASSAASAVGQDSSGLALSPDGSAACCHSEFIAAEARAPCLRLLLADTTSGLSVAMVRGLFSYGARTPARRVSLRRECSLREQAQEASHLCRLPPVMAPREAVAPAVTWTKVAQNEAQYVVENP